MIKYFKSLNSGVKRSIIVGNLIIALIIGLLCEFYFYEYSNGSYSYMFESIVSGSIIYWIIVISGLWIHQGFEKNKDIDK